jgi:hypothetical protein
MLSSILVAVGLPLVGVAVGWLAKRWHANGVLDEAVHAAVEGAATVAHDMGHPDVRDAITKLNTKA